ncbi:YjjG family noncanonical pyrimidine nucleotidase [Bacillus sp. J37]|uniref:YjjG family noncanonical pyrimidine nucleotidase n=1 Tax=Bacillus sp. J37 TaxID=935837 RepID=UPI00047878D9|nr:YjjG family noncanonical pyrimidine nucleotidase [Bacillus sp. J37]
MKHYDIILFDIDDTLFDFTKSEQEAFNRVFEKYNLFNNLKLYEKSYHEISKVLWRDLENGKMSLVELGSERFRRLFLEHELEIDAVVFNQDYLGFLGEQTHLVQGAEKVISELSNKRLAIITNGYTDVQTSRTNNSPLKDTFEHIIISESTGFQKPQTGIFDYAFDKLQITDKSNVLMVGDSLTSDIQGGINYGIDTCWFNPKHKENNTSLKPTYEINKLESLLEIIK